MTDPHIEPLPRDIAALLDRERDAYPEDAAMKAAMLARIETAVALAPPPGAAAPGPHGPAGGTSGAAGAGGAGAASVAGAGAAGGVKGLIAVGVLAFVAGAVTGGAVVKSSFQDPVAAPSAPVAATSAAPQPPREEREQRENVERADRPAAPAPAPSEATGAAERAAHGAASGSAKAAAPSSAPGRGDLNRERELLDAAHAALSRGRAGDALAAAERHAREWPRGYLGEEREVVMIQALAASGRRGEAEARAARFRKAYSRSMLLPAVEAAVGPPPASP